MSGAAHSAGRLVGQGETSVGLSAEDARLVAGALVELAGPALDRLAELVGGRAVPRLVDAAGLADALGVSRSYVYDHADELAPVRLPGGGLRFDVARTVEHLAACDRGRRSPEPDGPSAGALDRPACAPRVPVPVAGAHSSDEDGLLPVGRAARRQRATSDRRTTDA